MKWFDRLRNKFMFIGKPDVDFVKLPKIYDNSPLRCHTVKEDPDGDWEKSVPPTGLGKKNAMSAPIMKRKDYVEAQSNKNKIIKAAVEVLDNSHPFPKIPRGYKRHDGGKCPVKKSDIFYIFYRDGNSSNLCRLSDNTIWDWSHTENPWDIIAYKVVKKATSVAKKKPSKMKRGRK